MGITVLTTKILLVEDEIVQRRLLTTKLEKEGYSVVSAVDGREGLQFFLADPELRLVITDISMPEMDGFQLIKAIREQEARYTYIIVLTAREDKQSLLKALSLGADDYLTKPVLQDELSLRLAGGRRLLKLESQEELILAMVKLAGARSGETGAHLDRVKAYSLILANDLAETQKQLGANRSVAEEIANVSPLHDIGKVAIYDSILHKRGRLTTEEFDLMKTHTTVGGNILKDIYERAKSPYLRLAYEVAMFHHERWDGTGYPQGLRGEEIPLAARIVALADVFDALTFERCYKEAFAYEKAKEIVLAGKGSHFDPMVVDAYLRHEEEWLAVLEQYREG